MDDTQTDGTNAGTEGTPVVDAPPSTVEPAPADTSEATTEQPTGADDTGEAEKPSETPKRKPWWEKRFDELTAKRYEAERRAAYLEGQLASTQQPQQAEPSGPPTEEDYNWDRPAYLKALEEYVKSAAGKAASQELERRTNEQQERTRQETAFSRLQQGTAKFADFHDVVSDIPVTDAVADLLTSNDNAADILYELGKNPEAVAHFTRLSPYSQAMELGKLAARLDAPKPPSPKPIPPPPPQTVAGSSSGIQKKPEEMSMAEYVEWAKVRDKS